MLGLEQDWLVKRYIALLYDNEFQNIIPYIAETVKIKNVCHIAEMFNFDVWHQMASSTFDVMAFDCYESWNVLEAIWCQAAKLNISATLQIFLLF